MSVRDFLNNNSAVVTVGAVLLLIMSLFLLMRSCVRDPAPQGITNNYYYDLNADKLYVAKATEIPPIATEGGQKAKAVVMGVGEVEVESGVKAYVFACGDCSDESKRFIGYLEMYTPDAQKALRDAQQKSATDPAAPEAMLMYEEGLIRGRLIRRHKTDDGSVPQWVASESEAGVAIVMELSTRCPKDVRLKPCYPAEQGAN